MTNKVGHFTKMEINVRDKLVAFSEHSTVDSVVYYFPLSNNNNKYEDWILKWHHSTKIKILIFLLIFYLLRLAHFDKGK